ncbi:L-type lectin-domain containing receptor kinase -like [Olea europaea subsp. europaea]|uniref:L-type lectin-domain containing receptor kinase -like n=1 Tax=Olea europaea subsp. europaea TaxID=158383 RepID=A0A8S0PKF4_OLEEU|nr:L-type lectin-domain containing receptor kinase -like [Olea europaea subsp. europaea]
MTGDAYISRKAFRFVIDSSNSNCHADGLTFFLAPVDSTIPRNSSGSGLDLAYFDAMANISGDPFVAVESDTYTNDWDPYGPHVGIDINSLISVTNFTWRDNITEGRQNDAWIGYNLTTKNLSVIFTGYMSNQKQKSRLDYKVDLRNYLPELVLLGEGGFGGVYQGFLRDLNSYIAVKTVLKDSKQGHRKYALEVKIISTKLPQGLASTLLYLHDGCEQCVIHRDIKSSNIILDSNFNAKLGDFGLARLVDHEKGSQTTVLAGTMGYMAPECVTTDKACKESNVYSFGIVALEIACGRRPIDAKAQANRVRMAEWVWDLYGTGKLLEAADPKLCADYDEQEIERLMVIGLWYAHPDNNPGQQSPAINEGSYPCPQI